VARVVNAEIVEIKVVAEATAVRNANAVEEISNFPAAANDPVS
jgi:hypothetical protein